MMTRSPSTDLSQHPQRSVVRKHDELGSELEDDPRPNYKVPSTGKTRKTRRLGELGSKANRTEIQVSCKRPRRRNGFLEKVVESPLELMFEIFSYLHPIDLIRLSRTTKDLRSLLQRSSQSVRKNARENVKGLPPLPSYMSEPYYANLLFDAHCQCCSQATILVQWEASVRYCKRCLENSGIFVEPSPPVGASLRATVLRRTPCDCSSIWSLYPSGKFAMFFFTDSNSIRSCVFPSICLLEEESHKGFNDSWLIRKTEELSSRRANARALKQWAKERGAARSFELESVRCKRFKDVTDRLTALGWREEIAKQMLMC
ncbi:hypothetical protein F5146DRAFT_230505 [Armillaria mellea]|nr:hypothetical protein F5146DRAFT_230505 [Armillaria mellea]